MITDLKRNLDGDQYWAISYPLAQYVRRWRGKNNSLSIVFHWNFFFPNCPLLSRMVTCDLWLISCYAPTCNFIKQCLILRFEVTYTSAQAQIMWSTILYWYLFCCIGQNSLTLTNFETCISRAFDAIASSSGGIQTWYGGILFLRKSVFLQGWLSSPSPRPTIFFYLLEAESRIAPQLSRLKYESWKDIATKQISCHIKRYRYT